MRQPAVNGSRRRADTDGSRADGVPAPVRARLGLGASRCRSCAVVVRRDELRRVLPKILAGNRLHELANLAEGEFKSFRLPEGPMAPTDC
jgi:hypothetical protein